MRGSAISRKSDLILTTLAAFATALIAMGPSVAPAQLTPAQSRELNQVYVRDSSIAVEKFALAERMHSLREWHKAADVYQEVLVNYADRVVPSESNPQDQVVQYTSVVSAVQERLSRWPAEGLVEYRARYEVEAQALLDTARPGDLSTLHRVHATYFVTEAGRAAGVRLVDAQLEAGEFAAAAWTAQRMLDLHPDLSAATSPLRAMLLYRAGLALHLAGDTKQATARLDELRKNFPDAIGRVRGEDTLLADSLEADLAAPQPSASASSSDSWPMAYGSPDRARVSRTVNSIGANLYTIELSRLESASPRLGISPQDGQSESDRRSGFMTGVLPVVDRGELFFQDNARVYAVNLESSLALPGWAQTYDGNRGGRYAVAGAVPTPRGQLCTISVTDNSVLAIMGLNDIRIAAQMGGRRETRLVCLDRRTGAERWTSRPAQLAESAPPAAATAMRELDFSGSPLVVGDSVYVMGRGSKGMQFEDCYVFCIDLASGKSKWSTYVASANIAGQFFDESIGGTQQSISHLAYASGRIFCLTNLGAIAAINAYDGTMAWLNIYPREEADFNARLMGMRSAPSPRKPWSFNPVIVSDQNVFVLPGDGKNLHVYDAGSGKEIRKFGTALRQEQNRFNDAQANVREQLNMIVGVVPASGDLVLATDRSVLRVDWRTFEPMSEKGLGIKWKKAFEPPTFAGARDPSQFGRDGTPMPTIRGRPFLSTESVFVPTAWQLQTIALRNGASVHAYPADRSWNDDEEPGNILATSEYLVIAGPTHVTVYTDMQLALRRLDSAIAAAPNDPDPRLRYAEVMFVSQKLEASLAKLDEAIDLLGGRKSMAPGANRERVFADALTFAQKLSRPPLVADQAATINGLFDRALDAAQSPSQQLNLRLSRADYCSAAQDPATELRMYQEVLASPQMRSITVARAESGIARQAALVARQGVSDLLSRPGGRALYEPYEKQASAALEENRLSADPAKLLEIAQVYPNSTAGRTASLLAADSYESAGNARQAVQSLRQLYFRVPSDAPERLRIIEALARNYLSMPNHLDVAATRLAQAAKLATDNAKLSRPMRLPDGQILQDITFAQALDVVRRIQSRAADKVLPDLHLPNGAASNAPSFKPSSASPIIPGVSAICMPLRDFSRTDRLVVYAPAEGLAVYAVGAAQPRFVSTALSAGPQFVAWTGGNLLAWDRSTLVMLDGESGKTVWQMSLATLPTAEMLAAGDTGEFVANDTPANGINGVMDVNVQNLRVQGQVQIVVGGQRRIIRRAQRGVPVPVQPALPANPAGPEQIVGVQPLSDRVVIATSDGRVVSVDLAEGKLLWQSRAMKATIEKLVANDDFIALKLCDGAFSYLIAMETAQGQPVFRWKLNVRDAGGNPSLLNLALASDGTLVWVMPARVAGEDLFAPGDVLRFGDAPLAGAGHSPLLSAGGNDQFIVADGRILAVADGGANVWVMSLDQGVMLRGSDGAEMRLSTRSQPNETDPQMRIVGSMLHIASQNPTRIVTYDLNQPGWFWDGKGVDDLDLRQVLVARDQLVIVAERVPRKRGAARILAFSRKPELKGLVESMYDFVEPVGSLSCQAVDGGIYYLAGDQRLHFIAGAGDGK
ncbi:hypothetical protein BH09PLA1_BH09PLA1_06420 [soil metagenome]